MTSAGRRAAPTGKARNTTQEDPRPRSSAERMSAGDRRRHQEAWPKGQHTAQDANSGGHPRRSASRVRRFAPAMLAILAMLGSACAWLRVAPLAPLTHRFPREGEGPRNTGCFGPSIEDTGRALPTGRTMAASDGEQHGASATNRVAYVIETRPAPSTSAHRPTFRSRLRRHNEGGGSAFTKMHQDHGKRSISSRCEACAQRSSEQTWTNHLRATGTLPFLTFTVTAYGPLTHHDAALREARARRSQHARTQRVTLLETDWDNEQ